MIGRRKSRLRAGVAAVVVAACAALFAGQGLADTPPGQGLFVLPIPFSCDDGIGVVMPTVNPAASAPGGPAWLNGQLVLIQEVTVIQDGTIVFHKVYGPKTGQQPTATCTGTEPDGTLHIVKIVLIP
jgi:hypothetical protein